MTTTDPNKPPAPWERQPGESAKAWEARRIYLEMGPSRSLEKVSQKYTKSIPLLKRWSVSWNWVSSARQYDAYIDDLARKQALESQVMRRQVEAAKWDQRSETYADMLYTPFIIASNDLIRAEKAAEKADKPIPYRQKESMIRSIARAAPLAELGLELARQRLGQGSSVALGLLPEPPRGSLKPGLRLAMLKTVLDFEGIE